MRFYDELQLSSIGSKQLIRATQDKKEKRRHILIYNFKVYLVVAFCFAVVTIFSQLFGSANSVVGVSVLLAVMVLRQVDFGIKTSHSIGVIFCIFGILAVGPKASNLAGPFLAFFINLICIFSILFLCCHNVIMSNHSTFVLTYLLLQGYDVSGQDFQRRLFALAVGAVICAAVFWHTHKDRTYKRGFRHLFEEFHWTSTRNQWYLRLTLGLSSAMLIGALLRLPRVMWIGIASMSVLLPFTTDMTYRVKRRAPFNILGCGIFLLLYRLLPDSLYAFIGIIGGIGVGYSAGYAWQTVFNTFGALAIATEAFGLSAAIILRIMTNLFGSLYSLGFDWLFCQISDRIPVFLSRQNRQKETGA